MNNEELERRIALLTAENEELRQKVCGVDQESIWQMENENDKLKELLAASYAALHTAVNVYREECCGDSLCGICAYDLPARIILFFPKASSLVSISLKSSSSSISLVSFS